jgi:hypothetical protein
MPTAQQLVDMATALNTTIVAINAIVGKQPLPADADTKALADKGAQIAIQANAIGQAAMAALAADVQSAVSQLTTQVNAANSTLQKLNEISKAINVVGVVLTGAASIAASVATGNWLGTAGDVVTLATNLQTAINANQPAAPTVAGAAGGP